MFYVKGVYLFTIIITITYIYLGWASSRMPEGGNLFPFLKKGFEPRVFKHATIINS